MNKKIRTKLNIESGARQNVNTTSKVRPNIQKLREQINTFDRQIIDLIAKRQALMPAVGLYKKQNKIAINQPTREKEILLHIKTLAGERHLNPLMLERIFKNLFKDAKERQKKI